MKEARGEIKNRSQERSSGICLDWSCSPLFSNGASNSRSHSKYVCVYVYMHEYMYIRCTCACVCIKETFSLSGNLCVIQKSRRQWQNSTRSNVYALGRRGEIAAMAFSWKACCYCDIDVGIFSRIPSSGAF